MKYNLSTDYEKLYEEIQDGNPVAAFVDYDYLGRDKSEEACRDICQIIRKGQYDIDFFVRGMSYMGIYPFLDKNYGVSEKEVFINSCKSTNLEWIDHGINNTIKNRLNNGGRS